MLNEYAKRSTKHQEIGLSYAQFLAQNGKKTHTQNRVELCSILWPKPQNIGRKYMLNFVSPKTDTKHEKLEDLCSIFSRKGAQTTKNGAKLCSIFSPKEAKQNTKKAELYLIF